MGDIISIVLSTLGIFINVEGKLSISSKTVGIFLLSFLFVVAIFLPWSKKFKAKIENFSSEQTWKYSLIVVFVYICLLTILIIVPMSKDENVPVGVEAPPPGLESSESPITSEPQDTEPEISDSELIYIRGTVQDYILYYTLEEEQFLDITIDMIRYRAYPDVISTSVLAVGQECEAWLNPDDFIIYALNILSEPDYSVSRIGTITAAEFCTYNEHQYGSLTIDGTEYLAYPYLIDGRSDYLGRQCRVWFDPDGFIFNLEFSEFEDM